MPVLLDGESKDIAQVRAVACLREKVVIPSIAAERIEKSRRVVEQIVAEGRRVYGITTGFGKFADVSISRHELRELQENLVRSHATGVGEPFSQDEVRAAILLRANALAKGMSGIRLSVVQMLVELLNRGVTPVVPRKGSVGASGDLAPLAHISLVLLGGGEAWCDYGDKGPFPGAEALRMAGLEPIALEAKEGLALTNGVQMTAAVLSLAVHEAGLLAKTADIVASLTGQALRCIPNAYDERLVGVRPHRGAGDVAWNLRTLLSASGFTTSPGEIRVQDPYTIRCIPQVHGAVRQAIGHVETVVEVETGSATDNPLVFPDGHVVSGGNFHGQPLAVAADYLSAALCSLANMSERRTARLMSGTDGLPLFLTPEGGLNSGLMLLQYTAAALASESKTLSHPAGVDTVPTSADQEDHVSMSTIAARKAREIASNVANVLAIEYLSASQALELRGERGSLSPSGAAAISLLRSKVRFVAEDREMAPDIAAARELVLSGELVRAVEQVTGELK
jgi:histidine ammonia-lyase